MSDLDIWIVIFLYGWQLLLLVVAFGWLETASIYRNAFRKPCAMHLPARWRQL